MKNFRSTALFTLFVLVLVAYTAFEYRQAQQEVGLAEDEELAFTVTPEKINEVKLTRPTETILLVKSGDHWQLKKPIEDLAEDSAVDGLLYSLTAQRLRRMESEERTGKKINWSEFGLSSETTRFELKAGDKSESLTIGTKNAYDGSFYVRKGDELLLGDQGLAQLQDRQTSSFRSRRVWRDRDGELLKITVNPADGKAFTLTNTSDKWLIEPKPAFAVDQLKITDWIRAIQELMPSDFAKEKLEEGDKEKFLLSQPSYKVQIDYKQKDQRKKWEMVIGQAQGDEIYLYSSLRPVVLKTSVTSLAPVRLKAADFRDGKKPFAFDVEKARKVEVQTKDLSRNITKKDGEWTLESGSKGETLEQEKLVQLVQKIRALEAKEFFAEADKELGPAEIVVRDDKDKVLFSLNWGAEHKPSPLRYVKTNLDPSLLGVEKDKLEKLVDPSMIKKSQPENQKSENH